MNPAALFGVWVVLGVILVCFCATIGEWLNGKMHEKRLEREKGG